MKAKISSLAGALLWLTFVVGTYYWIHKPFTPALARQLGGATLDVLLCLLLLSLGGGLGRKLAQNLLTDLHIAENLAASALLGLGGLAVLILVVGMVNLSFLSMVLLLLLMGSLTWSNTRTWLIDFYHWVSKLEYQSGIGIFLALNLGMGFIMASAPPTTFDTLTYQLVGAKLWVAEGHFSALPHNHFFGFPQLVNTLYAAQIALLNGRLTSAALLQSCVAVLWLMLIGGYAARRFNAPSSRYAPAILLTATSIWLQMGWAYVDLFTGAFGMLAWIALDEWLRRKNRSALIWLGIACGLAMSVKYNAALLGGGIALYMLLRNWRNAWAVVQMVLIAALVLAPWLLRTWIFYDNPVYPFGITTGEWDELSNTWYSDSANAPLRQTPALVLPIFLSPTFIGIEGAIIWSATIGALFLLLIPLLGLTWSYTPREWRDPLRQLLWLVLLFHLIWLSQTAISVFGGQTRFMYPIFGWLAVLAGVSLASFDFYPQKPLYLAWMIRMVFMFVLFLTTLNHLAGTRPPKDAQTITGTTLLSHFVETRALDYLLGVISEEDYLIHNMGWYYEAIQQVNRLPNGSKILFLWETRSLYCDEPRITCVEDTILMRWWHDRRLTNAGSTLVEDWQTQGITHILVWEDGRNFEFRENNKLTAEDQSSYYTSVDELTVAWQGDSVYTLYVLNK